MHLGGNMLRNVYSERLRGYKQALKDHNIEFDEKLLYISNLNEQAGLEAAERILSMSLTHRPDAVFASNDTAAAHCMIRLKHAGISIPDEIGFVGFNNDPISKVVEPNLTTVYYPGYSMGEASVTALINHLNGISNIKSTNSIILRSDLVVRQSSAKIKTL
jgi:LacI family transcriptional regulator